MISTPASSAPATSAALVSLPDAPEAAVPQHVRRFVREQRLAHPNTTATIVRLACVVVVAAALLGVGFALDSWALWVPIWLALALLSATPIALMHEAVHHNLFRSRFANHLAGVVAATTMFFHGPAYRAWHLTHHAFTFTPDDSEQLPTRFGSRLSYLAYCLVLGPSFAVVLWYGAIATLVGRPPKWVRGPRIARHVRAWTVLSLVLVAVIVAATLAWPAVVVKGWLIPAGLGSVLLFPFLTMPEHYQGKGTALLGNTRTTESNAAMRYLYWNNNLHTAHHLVPTVPPKSLPLLDETIALDNTLRATGFFAFHRAVLRELPWLPTRRGSDPGQSSTDEGSLPIDMGEDTGGITISNRVEPHLIDSLWAVYERCFEPLRDKALLDHFYSREVFEELIGDPRTFKVIGWLDEAPAAVALATNELSLVPQISPPFLHRRYPQYAARNAIYFGVFICVDPTVKSNTLFARLVSGLGQVGAVNDSVMIFDMAQVNCDAGVDRMINKVCDWFPGSTAEHIDSQHYFARTMPAPLKNLPFSKSPMPEPVIDLRAAPAPLHPSEPRVAP